MPRSWSGIVARAERPDVLIEHGHHGGDCN
jgi:hypothetical protein